MKKLQLILLLFFGFTSQYIKAQTASYVVTGKVQEPFENRYALLYLPERKITLSQLIENAEFKFSIDKKLKFETAMLYFGMDSTKDFIAMQLNKTIGKKETVIIVLEDSVKIEVNNDLKTAKIIGGSLNNDLKDMNTAIKSGDYLNFFTTHPNSQVSILFLKTLTNFKKSPLFSDRFDYELYYKQLSEDLRNSPEGKALWDVISK